MRSDVRVGIAAGATAAMLQMAPAASPRYDHIVIVIEENHSFANVIGNPDAAFINQLAQNGQLLTDMFGMVHPSQPNYIHFFAGDELGVSTNNVPAVLPFTAPNLGASLIAGGFTFVGYSEDLPGVGSNVAQSGQYWRKHNPWVNWQMDPPGPNQLSSSTNRPFTDFPSDLSLLPSLSIVVPNQDHDMHDGTIAMADAWLQANLGAYADWCADHNSLLIITWDEDSFASRNHIPTILYGPGVRPGTNDARATLHDLLRTVEDAFGVAHSGAAAKASGIPGAFQDQPAPTVVKFRHGVGGYSGTSDTWIEAANPALVHSAETQLTIDGSPLSQGLIRFDGIFGVTPGRVPLGAKIVSAKLSLVTGVVSTDASASSMGAHRLLVPFEANATWDSLGGGVSLGAEAVNASDFSFVPRNSDVVVVFDVTSSLRAWSAGDANHGWVIVPGGTDGWRPVSGESSDLAARPQLSVAYVCVADLDNGSGIGTPDGGVTIDDLLYYLSLFEAGYVAADLDDGSGTGTPDGGVTIDDLLFFLVRFEAGC